MIRLIALLAILGSPALAHATGLPHLHSIDTVTLGMGVALIVVGLVAGWLIKDGPR